jgi:hypothetical protein
VRLGKDEKGAIVLMNLIITLSEKGFSVVILLLYCHKGIQALDHQEVTFNFGRTHIMTVYLNILMNSPN